MAPPLTPARLRPRRRAALVSACIVLVVFSGLGLASVVGFGPVARHPAVVPPSRPSATATTPRGRAAPSGQPVTGAPQQQPGTQQADAQQSAPAADHTTPARHGKGRKHGHQDGQGNDDAQGPGASD